MPLSREEAIGQFREWAINCGKCLDRYSAITEEERFHCEKLLHEGIKIKDILNHLDSLTVMNELVVLAYTTPEFANPYWIISVIQYDSGEILWALLMEYLSIVKPEKWSIPLLELFAHSRYTRFADHEWRRTPQRVRSMFKKFASGPVSPEMHSPQFYMAMADLFFDGVNPDGSVPSKFVQNFRTDCDNDSYAQMFQGLLAAAKEGKYIWDFEGFMHGK